MIARCPFNDAEAGTLRRTGDTFDCSEERARRLVALKLAAVAKNQEAAGNAPAEPVQEEKPPEKTASGKGKGKASPKKTK